MRWFFVEGAAMAEQTKIKREENRIASFLRKRDYRIIKELGAGACGRTVLLHDDLIDEHFVCKKYTPCDESRRSELFRSFVREIKLLHRLHHKNVVRVFNYYVYPDTYSGYILMEYVPGLEIDKYIKQFPERISDCFAQAIEGFAYLESSGVLHRDIRADNLMVTDEGLLKIIDLGFGKRVTVSADFKKSITLNWHCATPAEFANSIYDFLSEMYFLGKLFEKLIADNHISDFKYFPLLASMCAFEPQNRPPGFGNISSEIQSGSFHDLEFSDTELSHYREFASSVFASIGEIAKTAKYINDTERILLRLTELLRKVSMEVQVPQQNAVLRCLIDGEYSFYKARRTDVHTLRNFVEFFSRTTEARRRVILASLHAKLDAIDRYTPGEEFRSEDIPF